jgi:23S rRNA (uracil1939-C5)-methyltransferase
MSSAPAPCSHRPPCPGCPRYGASGLAPDKVARLNQIADTMGIDAPDILRGPRLGWRRRARLAVRGRARSPKIGVFEEDSHRIVDIPRCGVHHPLINDGARRLRASIRATGLAPWHESAPRGLLRYAQFTATRDAADETERLQIVLVVHDSGVELLRPLAADLEERLGDRLQGLFGNPNPTRGNRILGEEFVRLAGAEDFAEDFGASRVHVPPGAFFQSNADLFGEIVTRIQAWIPDGRRVLELYGGVGTIGLGLAARSRELVIEEIAPDSLRGLERGRAALSEELRGRVIIDARPAAAAVGRIADAEVVIADPPRKGLDPEVRAALRAHPPEHFVLVSCGFEAFLRDLEALTSDGRLRLRELVAADLFPMSDHLEVIAHLTRA